MELPSMWVRQFDPDALYLWKIFYLGSFPLVHTENLGSGNLSVFVSRNFIQLCWSRRFWNGMAQFSRLPSGENVQKYKEMNDYYIIPFKNIHHLNRVGRDEKIRISYFRLICKMDIFNQCRCNQWRAVLSKISHSESGLDKKCGWFSTRHGRKRVAL